ncbi:MAG: UvrD-helicase domain-containing protein, partial [Bacteroidales bacterium]|nr:UvrD-helicase domain-containing protein [Bacteroidales bacterium]
MQFIGDFHIHSHFSIATSKQLTPEYLDYWARIKGISVIGTGDFTHPGWLDELKEKLEPAEHGLFKLRPEFIIPLPFSPKNLTRFVLTAEISNIYKKNGKVRKVHNVVFAPDFETVEKIQSKLQAGGFNITSDGRPILGMDSKNLLDLCLECSEDIFFIPAHIWTPWFSVLGSKSGFDRVEECFEDLSDYIYAVETGLSTDPPMNWMCSFLDKYTLTANSDAHSPEKLGRNANLFNTSLDYPSIIGALKTGDPDKFRGTIDFFPQEGKYHFDGHRKCKIRWDPIETLRNNEICPDCGKKVTVGVMNRIAQLADRDDILQRKKRHPYRCLIPLKELLAEIYHTGPASKKIHKLYLQLVGKSGSEFNLLLFHSLEKISEYADETITEAITRMRNREVYITEGFDGEYGTIKVFGESELSTSLKQEYLFQDKTQHYKAVPRPLLGFDLKEYREIRQDFTHKPKISEEIEFDLFSQPKQLKPKDQLNPEQQKAAEHTFGPALVQAGPGTGKTKVLTNRIAFLINQKIANPEEILAITFTNKAAEEIKKRLKTILSDPNDPEQLKVQTFHSFG